MRIRYVAPDPQVWRLTFFCEEEESFALDLPLLTQLIEHLEAAQSDEGCRVIVLDSQPGTFCRGMDLDAARRPQSARAPSEQPDEEAARALALYGRCLAAMAGSAKPVVCVVDGVAQGGGVGLAAAAHVVIASPRAEFSLPECALGLIPAMVLPTLLRRMPRQKAQWLALSCRRLDVVAAERLGLVDILAPGPAAALERALREVLRSLLRLRPRAVAHLAQFLDEVAALELQPALDRGAARTHADLKDSGTIEALEAMAAGDIPRWFSRYKPRT